MTREDLVPLSKGGTAGNQERPRIEILNQSHGAQIARRVLRMVENVSEIAAKFDRLTFTNRELPRERHVKVVDGVGLQSIPAGIGIGAYLRFDVHCGRIFCDISD